MKHNKDFTYKDNAEKYNLIEGVPGEQAQFDLAAKIINDFASKQAKGQKDGISILDLCCGTMPIIRKTLEKYGDLNPPTNYKDIIGVDISDEYLQFVRNGLQFETCGMGSRLFGLDINLIHRDATEYAHPEKVDLILASSAYHHMDDKTKIVHNPKKQKFLQKIHEQLKDDGIVVFCENLIRDYNGLEEYFKATKEFYVRRTNQLLDMGINDDRIELLLRVMKYGLDIEYELKASYRIFTDDLKKSKFEIISEEKVWPENNLFNDEKVGDFVIVAKKSD